MRKLIVVLAAASVMAGGTVLALPPVAATAAASSPARIAWGKCSDPSLKQAHAQCGILSVPLDYSHPNGAHDPARRLAHRAHLARSQYQGSS